MLFDIQSERVQIKILHERESISDAATSNREQIFTHHQRGETKVHFDVNINYTCFMALTSWLMLDSND